MFIKDERQATALQNRVTIPHIDLLSYRYVLLSFRQVEIKLDLFQWSKPADH
jgi:uncharacterized Zn finger protein